MPTNRQISDTFIATLDEMDKREWPGIKLPHTLIRGIKSALEYDERDWCSHDACVYERFAVTSQNITALFMPNEYELHFVLLTIIRDALSEMAGNTVASEAEEFLRNL